MSIAMLVYRPWHSESMTYETIEAMESIVFSNDPTRILETNDGCHISPYIKLYIHKTILIGIYIYIYMQLETPICRPKYIISS